MQKILIILSLLFTTALYSQGSQSSPNNVQVNLYDLCQDIEPGKTTYQSQDLKVSMPATSLLTLKSLCDKATSQNIEFTEEKNKDDKWEVRLFFGFARTHYWKTDIKVSRPGLGTNTIQGVQFQERHGGHHFDPSTWDSFQSAFQWIDEPTNRIEFTLQKGKHVIYVSYFHPKYFLSSSNSEVVYKTSNGNQTFREATNGIDNLQISQGNIDLSLGYGYQFKLLGKKKGNGLFITPRLAAGPVGSIFRYNNDGVFTVTPFKVDGFSLHAGTRLEFKHKKLGAFIDASYISRWVNHSDKDLNLNVQYHLQYAPVTFGVSYEIFKFKKRKLRRSKKSKRN